MISLISRNFTPIVDFYGIFPKLQHAAWIKIIEFLQIALDIEPKWVKFEHCVWHLSLHICLVNKMFNLALYEKDMFTQKLKKNRPVTFTHIPFVILTT